DVAGELGLDPAGRFEQAVEQIFARAELADGSQLGADGGAAVADLVAASAFDLGGPKQLFAATGVAHQRQNALWPRTGAEPAASFVSGQVTFEEVANWTGRELGSRVKHSFLLVERQLAAAEAAGDDEGSPRVVERLARRRCSVGSRIARRGCSG